MYQQHAIHQRGTGQLAKLYHCIHTLLVSQVSLSVLIDIPVHTTKHTIPQVVRHNFQTILVY
jgi:hypothetical protein